MLFFFALYRFALVLLGHLHIFRPIWALVSELFKKCYFWPTWFDQLNKSDSSLNFFCFLVIYRLLIRPHAKFHVNKSRSFWNIKNKRFLTNSVYRLGALTLKHFLLHSIDSLWCMELTYQISWELVYNFLFYWFFKYFLVGKADMLWPTHVIWL